MTTAKPHPPRPSLLSVDPTEVGAVHIWMSDRQHADLLPCLVKLHRCPTCVGLVLADDSEAHRRFHRRRGDA